MTAPVPEEYDEGVDLTEPPADEHPSEAPDAEDADPEEPESDRDLQAENAGSSQDQPSQ